MRELCLEDGSDEVRGKVYLNPRRDQPQEVKESRDRKGAVLLPLPYGRGSAIAVSQGHSNSRPRRRV